jgi:hypothetical protein
MLGGGESFAEMLATFRKNPALADLPLLVFHYPNNGSLACSGEFLAREMARVLAEPAQALFVCHSAGGLVVRYYTERKQGPFQYAVFLGTPHQGSSLRRLKFLMDLSEFGGAAFKIGFPATIAKIIPEGKGEIANDLEPDSLFLRHLGQDAERAKRYHVIYGKVLRGPGGFLAAITMVNMLNHFRPELIKLVEDKGGKNRITEHAKTAIRDFMIPEEILNGDLVVRVPSARLAGANEDPASGLSHPQLLTDPEMIRRVMKIVASKRTKS